MFLNRANSENWILLGASMLFVLASAVFVYLQAYIFLALPLLLIAGIWAIFSPSKVFYALVFLAPLSITLRWIVPDLPFDFWFPTEPMLVFLLVLLIAKSISEQYFRKELLSQPVFWAILFFLGWILVTVAASEMIVVSLKYFLVRFWFIGVFFYLAYLLFRKNLSNIDRFLWAYIAGMLVVILWASYKQVNLGFLNQKAAHGASTPFFIDHTSYGAAIAFSIPILVAFTFHAKSKLKKYLIGALTIFFAFALVFSYSRAAWLSLVIGFGVWLLIALRIKFRTVAVGSVLLGAFLYFFIGDIINHMEKNTTESSGNLLEHVQSIYNIRTDASNKERVNRWNAALEMFVERPLFGWGPGTYMFMYAPFQRSQNTTIISTNLGTGGNAHSEYLGLMSEAGVLAVLGYVLIIVFALSVGLKGLSKIPDKRYRRINIACVIGLITYVFHGFLNNFLDADKIAAPFWGFIAIIVAINLHFSVGKDNFASKRGNPA